MPPYRFLPGRGNPHPEKKGGYFFEKEQNLPPPSLLCEDDPEGNQTYLYSLDLFNHHYYWEAHVWLELLWNAHSRSGPIADFLKALIKICAAGVNWEIEKPDAAQNHLLRARELLRDLPEMYLGINVSELRRFLQDKNPPLKEWSLLCNREIISLGGGCFWGVEYALKQLTGIEFLSSGYQGGRVFRPCYEEVCLGKTGHAEVVQIVFRPDKLPLKRILQAFFAIVDSANKDGQRADRGNQYRLAVFCKSDSQQKFVKKFVDEIFQESTVEIKIDNRFYLAENYHQNYLEKNPGGYCHIPLGVVQKIRSGQF